MKSSQPARISILALVLSGIVSMAAADDWDSDSDSDGRWQQLTSLPGLETGPAAKTLRFLRSDSHR